ncbi:MAG: DUF1028 domain-containing protein [Anaerolineae bacterium]
MTFSLAGRCADTGMLGAVISTSSPAVGARCIWVRSNAGVVLTQNVTNPSLGPLGCQVMADGMGAASALDYILRTEPDPTYRQLALLDSSGESADFSGANTLGVHAVAQGNNCISAGNLLDNTGIPKAMVDAFESSSGHLADRLLAALDGAQTAGGEAGPVHSAGLLVYHTQTWPICSLRVDWHDDPIAELRNVWNVYQPQMDNYILRAYQPADAPSYGVPGDE